MLFFLFECMDEKSLKRLVEWSQKAGYLRLKYEAEKAEEFDRLARLVGLKRKFFFWSYKGSPEEISDVSSKLVSIVVKKQIPLYNNMINYLPMVVGDVKKAVDMLEDKQMRRLFQTIEGHLFAVQEYAPKLHEIFRKQKEFLQQPSSSIDVVGLYFLYREEKKLLRKFELETSKIWKVLGSLSVKARKILEKGEWPAQKVASAAILRAHHGATVYLAAYAVTMVCAFINPELASNSYALLFPVRAVSKVLYFKGMQH